MSEPKPTEHIWAAKIEAGRVRVHAARLGRLGAGWMWLTDCGKKIPHHYAWFWAEYRTLNPDMALLCKRCWREVSS